MREDILANIDNPQQLEKLYRENKTAFKQTFNEVYPEIKDNQLATFWKERLNDDSSEISWGTTKDWSIIILATLLAGSIAKLPEILPMNEEFFYTRNISFIVFPFLAAYFVWKNNMPLKKILILAFIIIASCVFINLLPDNTHSDTLMLSSIHLPLLLWSVLGFAFIAGNLKNYNKRLDFLRYNGDLIVMTTLILIAGIILTGITIGLFSLIGLEIAQFYFDYFGIFGLAAAPIIGTYITQTNPQLVSKVSPIIAKIFSPLVLITLVVYLGAIIYSGKDPYNDREFLMTFNALLIGVMAIILFAVAETSRSSKSQAGAIILFLLSVVTVIVNGIAVSAILYRLTTMGITPNRLAVLGGNLLILSNLFVITYRLFKTITQKGNIEEVEKSIAVFLPVYCIWTMVVTFIFPWLFLFK